jgi:hypothetical protein
MYAVIGILIVLVIVYLVTKPKGLKESFVAEQSDTINIPDTIKPPPPVLKSDPQPAMDMGTLHSAPYQQVARNSPRPYQDPALIKTTSQRIKSAVEMLKGFLAFQANEIEYRSDPSIQLPLTTARADFQRLSDEANVIARNPGLQPDMTEQEMNEVMANLAYLQREVALIGANRPFDNSGLQNLEGFDDMLQQVHNGGISVMNGSAINLPDANVPATNLPVTNLPATNLPDANGSATNLPVTNLPAINLPANGSAKPANGSAKPANGSAKPANGSANNTRTIENAHNPASEQDLIEFSAKIQGEILRLTASGTTDPINTMRVSALTNIKTNVDETIQKLQSGSLNQADVQIMKSDIANALPNLGNPNEPLPSILQTFNLPMGLSNMLPPNPVGNQEATGDRSDIIKGYAKEFLQGVSASIGIKLKYISQREGDIEKARSKAADSTIDITGFPSSSDLLSIADGNTMSFGAEYPSRNVAESSQDPKAVAELSNANAKKMTDPYAADPRIEGRKPQHFDWKERSKHIEGQIRRRGYTDNTFGLMPPNNAVGADFSWKGYAEMICKRLQANMDTGLAQACGCPPGDWKW